MKTESQYSNESEENAAPQTSIPLDIKIHNVVCKFRTRCHINLRKLAMNGFNTELDLAHGRVEVKLKNPKCSAHVWTGGKVSIYGATSEDNCHKGARIVARMVQKVGFNVRMCGFEIVNVMGVVRMPFKIELQKFYNKHRGINLSYEPEIHAAANYKFLDTGANLKIFSTGSITATAKNVATLQDAVVRIYPLLEPFVKPGSFIDPNKIKEEEFDSDDFIDDKYWWGWWKKRGSDKIYLANFNLAEKFCLNLFV